MRKVARDRLVKEIAFFGIALGIITLDQVSKYLVKTHVALGQFVPETGFFRITHTTNTGGAFGIFANQAFLITLVAIAGVATILIYVRYAPLNRMPVRVALGLVLGGTVGNLIDRLAFGSVVDFIDIGVSHYRWATFNIADSALVVGIVVLLYFLVFQFGKGETLERGSG